jgi:DNA-binding response OmpR family regulator
MVLSNKINILFVEDDPNLGKLLKEFLQANGCEVKHFFDGENALGYFIIHHKQFHFCILDCTLPGIDGFETATRLRQVSKTCPLIFLTARSQKEDKIKGFKIGIDDYITKPFDEEELLLRIHSVIRRSAPNQKLNVFEEKLAIGSFIFNYHELSISGFGNSCRITKKEAEILKLLCENRNHICKREEILMHVWGKSDYFTGRSLDVFITRIRKYIKEDPLVEIENIHKVGYILCVKSGII